MNNANLKTRLGGKVKNTKKGNTVNMKETALTKSSAGYTALSTNALDIISENLKNQPLSHQLFDTVKAPTGGTTVFTVPGLSGDEILKELTGIILDYTTPRAYWDTPDPVEGTSPTCYSKNSLTSYPDGKPCAQCAYNEFGSKDVADSNAKACKEYIELYLLRQDSIMPVFVRVPATSKCIFQRYLMRLVSRMIPVCGVVTKITLEKATSKAGQAYAQFNFEAVGTISPDETESARAFGKKFVEILNANDDVLPDIQEAV